MAGRTPNTALVAGGGKGQRRQKTKKNIGPVAFSAPVEEGIARLTRYKTVVKRINACFRGTQNI